MKLYWLSFCLIPLLIFPQSTTFNFRSPDNIKKFADYLFCEGDFLRAAQEYAHIPADFRNDTTNFKIMLCYSKLNLYTETGITFLANKFSVLKPGAEELYLKNKFSENPSSFRVSVSDYHFPFELTSETSNYFLKLQSIYYLQSRYYGNGKIELLKPFNIEERKELEPFYELSMFPEHKSPALAGILSAIIPGSGKMYTEEWGDGITALIATGLFAFLAYDNFKADHQTRAWIFAGLGTFFYAGNIYGSIASAQIFNAKVDFEFNDGFRLFLEKKNYYLQHYDFCN